MHGHIQLHTNQQIVQLHVCAKVDRLMTFLLSDHRCRQFCGFMQIRTFVTYTCTVTSTNQRH